MKRLLLCLMLLPLAACQRPTDSAFYNRGGPEALVDSSSEVVNLSVAGPADVSQLSGWIAQDKPTRAELYCMSGTPSCTAARKALDQQHIPTMNVSSPNSTVALVYERVLARDCQQRYYDQASRGMDNYNPSPPSFGCSLSANIVQEVPDKRVFVNPSVMDPDRATGAVAAYGQAYAPKQTSATAQPYSVKESVVDSAKSD